jgi:hypothetical protein
VATYRAWLATKRREPPILIRPKADPGAYADCGDRSLTAFEASPLRDQPSGSTGNPQLSPICSSRQGQDDCGSGTRHRLPRSTRSGTPPVQALTGTCRPRPRNRAHDGGRCGWGPLRWPVGFGRAMERQIRRPGKRMSAAAAPGVKDLRWRPEASPSLTSGPFPWLCRLCSGPPAFAVNPRWGYARQKFRKIRFLVFLFAGRALSFPQAGPFESAARRLRQIEFSRICAE